MVQQFHHFHIFENVLNEIIIQIQSHLLRRRAHGHLDVIPLSWLSSEVVNHADEIHRTGSSARAGGAGGAPGARGLWEGPLPQRDAESSAEPEQGTGRRATKAHEHRSRTLISDPFVSFRTRQVSGRFCYGVMTHRMRKIPNPASTKALQARVCYPSIAYSILRIDKHRQPSPFYTFLGLVYDNYYMEIPYSMSWCKSRNSELLKWDDRSIYRDPYALL